MQLFSFIQILAQQRYSQFQRELWEKIQTIDKSHIYDDNLYRQVRYMSIIGPNALPPDQFDRVSLSDSMKIDHLQPKSSFPAKFNINIYTVQ